MPSGDKRAPPIWHSKAPKHPSTHVRDGLRPRHIGLRVPAVVVPREQRHDPQPLHARRLRVHTQPVAQLQHALQLACAERQPSDTQQSVTAHAADNTSGPPQRAVPQRHAAGPHARTQRVDAFVGAAHPQVCRGGERGGKQGLSSRGLSAGRRRLRAAASQSVKLASGSALADAPSLYSSLAHRGFPA